MNPTLIRPGLLVSLKTTVTGGVSYEKRQIEAEHADDGGKAISKWETTRLISDKAEHELAIAARGKARTAVTRVCCPSSFGLLCPLGNEEKLIAAIEEAQAVADAHNGVARFTRLEVFVITGRIADNDEQAARAIGSEVRDLIESMEAGVRAANPEAIREAANKARAMSGMLSDDAQRKVTAAIAEVRKVARDIVSRVEKAGERAADVVDGLKLEALQSARFAVLDLTQERAADGQMDLIEAAGRALDLEPESETQPAQPAAREIEIAPEV